MLFPSIETGTAINARESENYLPISGADPGFQARGGALKKLRRAEGGSNIFGVFRVKNHDFMPKNHIFSNFRGSARRMPPPPGSAPDLYQKFEDIKRVIRTYNEKYRQ